MVVVAAIAVALFLVVEFKDGLPPRYIVRSIPGRIKRLRPGMTMSQTYEILGLRKSWIWGGLDAPDHGGRAGVADTIYEVYNVRMPRTVGMSLRERAFTYQSSGSIRLHFHHGLDWNLYAGDPEQQLRLMGAELWVDRRKVAEMPGSK
jgi:hypothetical protein